MIVPKSTRIDLNRPRKEVIHLTQDDNTRQAKVMLYADGRPYDVTADVSGATVEMAVAYILPNGYGDQYTQTELGEPAVEQDASIKNLYTINIDGPVTDKVGFVELLIKFTTEAGQILHSFPLTLNVKRSRGSDVDPDGTPSSQSRYLRADLQVPATEEMTEPVGYNAETGQLVTTPGGGGGSATGAVRYDTTQSLNTTQKSRARTNIGAGTGTYSKPTNGIPIYDLNQEVQQSIHNADTAYQKPSGGIPASDMASAVQTALTAAGTAVQPSALNAYILRAAQGSKTASDTQEVHVDGNGKLWTQPGGDGGGSTPTVIENTKLITITYAAGDTYADMTAAQIFDEIENGPVNLVLIDRAGRQCALIAPPEESGGSYTAARFFTLDDSGAELIIYSISASGTVSSATIPIPEDSGGGSTPSNAVLYVAQSLTTAQKTQARTNIGAGTGSYSKPSSGIPKTDLASAVQTSLNNADSAYQKPLTGISEADLATESVVISPDTEHAGQYVSTRTYSQIAQASSDGFAIKPEFWPDNNTTIRGAVLDISSAASVFAFLDMRSTPRVYVFTINAQGVSVVSFAAGGGGGGGEGGGIYKTTVTITNNVSDTSPADILAAYQAGDVIECWVDGLQAWLGYLPSAVEVTFFAIDTDSGRRLMQYTVAPNLSVTATDWNIGNADNPTAATRTATQVGSSSGFQVYGNEVITVDGAISGFKLATASLPVMLPGQYIELRFTVGSAAINNASWPAWCHFLGGVDGTHLAANTYYKIMIDDAGNVVAGAREVSA